MTNRIQVNATVTKRQFAAATTLMLEQVTRLEVSDYEQICSSSLIVLIAPVNNTSFVSCQERPMHEDDRQSQTRVLDLLLDGGVLAIDDDGCNSCCHGKLWRRNAEN